MNFKVYAVLLMLLGCSEEKKYPQYQVSHGYFGVSESSAIAYRVWDNGDTDSILYTFDPEHYQEAILVVRLSMVPWDGLNVMAQKEYQENLKYIRSMKWIPSEEDTAAENGVTIMPGQTVEVTIPLKE